MPAHKKQFCPWGHDTFVIGRTKGGQCKECATNRVTVWRWGHIERQREIWREGKRRSRAKNADRYALEAERKKILATHWTLHQLRREGVNVLFHRFK